MTLKPRLFSELDTGKHKKFHKGVDFKLTLARFVTDVVKFRNQMAENGHVFD